MRPLQLLLGTKTCFLSPLPACRVTVSMKSQPIYHPMWLTHTHTTIQKISSVKFSVFLRRAVFVSVRGTWCLRCCHVSSRGPTLWTLFVFAGSLWQHLLNQHVGGWRAPRTPKKKKSIWFPFQKRARCSLAASTRSERVNTRFHFALRRTESCFSVFNWSCMRNNTESWTLAAVYLLH